jgi:hypothetical protein
LKKMTKSRSIHDVFEECLELVIKGESVEECLRRFPEHAGELKGLLETANATRKSIAFQPSNEFRERARVQLQTAFREQTLKPKRTGFLKWDWQPRWAVATTAVLLVMVFGSGTVLAAENSMPDQPLYAVKHATEWFRLAVTTSPDEKAKLNATLANERVNEIVYLAGKGNSGELLATARKLNSNLIQLTNLIGNNQEATLATDNERGTYSAAGASPVVTTSASKDTQSTSETSPSVILTHPSPVTNVSPGVNNLTGGISWSNIEVVVPPNASNAQVERAKLIAWIKYMAVQHPALLKETLASVPEDTRTALLQAIAVSETGYEKVLQSIETAP